MFRTARSKFDGADIVRKLKRFAEGTVSSYRRLFLLMIGVCIVFYLLPPIFRYLFLNAPDKKDPLVQCMDDRLTPYFLQNSEFDANIRHVSPKGGGQTSNNIYNSIPYVGNGYIGLEIAHDAALNIKSGRAMQLPIKFHPIISVTQNNGGGNEAIVMEYTNGIAHRFQCFMDYFVSYSYYAHRTQPNILMQELKLTNTRNTPVDVELIMPRILFQTTETHKIQLAESSQSGAFTFNELEVFSGTVLLKPADASKSIVITIVKPQMLRKLQLRKRGSLLLVYPIAVHYSKPLATDSSQIKEAMADTEEKAIQAMHNVLKRLAQKSDARLSLNAYRQEHINVWSDIWATGFTISTSKAEHSLNGDRINATMYAVLSQVRCYEFEEQAAHMPPNIRAEIAKALTYAEGCYDSYHTLQTENLWYEMNTLEQLNALVSSWLLTLEKQGCHNLVRAGASGVIQAMVLSIGGFRFSNQHLECNIHPKFLHRDFHFRRLNYGNKTHLNVTINVMDDNKAVINVALDRSDRSYYACDGGCLDDPVLLTQSRRQFPVKLTDPVTAILYITEDKKHMEELHHAIHVKEVVEAPAHEQHVIALHKHGHQLGGLPTLFWVSVCAIIIVFHVFLCKLIVKEYCESSDKLKYRYNKP